MNKKEEKKKVHDVSLVRPIDEQKRDNDWGMTDPPESGKQSTRNISIGGKTLNVKTQDMFLPQVDNSRY